MPETSPSVAQVVFSLVDGLPGEHLQHIADLLEKEAVLDWERLLHLLKASLPRLDAQERVRQFVADWQAVSAPPSPVTMALLLRVTAHALEQQQEKQKVELTWTGPRTPGVSLRRTDQALLELIHAAQQKVIIVSFAVYKAQAILSALEKAAARGVEIIIILESPDVSEGKIAYSTIRALGSSLRAKSRIFIWPYAKRPTTVDGKIGALHAKIGIADETHLYISSANLTEYAMNINMEMGVLLTGGELPGRAAQHFEELISNGTLSEIAVEE